ncbi:MAG: MazG-like family protein [Burkholderiales bacterium]|nr:MazG-like family protein [Burkholderiales bacterium]
MPLKHFAELLECFQWLKDNELDEVDKEHIAEEMSDILNYLILLAESLNIDLFKSALNKIEHNNDKYPIEKSKGSRVKYNKI